jgi:hypothetical protein
VRLSRASSREREHSPDALAIDSGKSPFTVERLVSENRPRAEVGGPLDQVEQVLTRARPLEDAGVEVSGHTVDERLMAAGRIDKEPALAVKVTPATSSRAKLLGHHRAATRASWRGCRGWRPRFF